MTYTHVFKVNKDKFDSVKTGLNVQVMRFKNKMPKAGDLILTEYEGEQKHSTITDVAGHEGLMKNWYLVQHEMKGV